MFRIRFSLWEDTCINEDKSKYWLNKSIMSNWEVGNSIIQTHKLRENWRYIKILGSLYAKNTSKPVKNKIRNQMSSKTKEDKRIYKRATENGTKNRKHKGIPSISLWIKLDRYRTVMKLTHM